MLLADERLGVYFFKQKVYLFKKKRNIRFNSFPKRIIVSEWTILCILFSKKKFLKILFQFGND